MKKFTNIIRKSKKQHSTKCKISKRGFLISSREVGENQEINVCLLRLLNTQE